MLKSQLIKSVLLVCILASYAHTQGGPASHVISGPTLPAKCSPKSGDIWVLTTNTPTGALYNCTATNTWTLAGGGAVVAKTFHAITFDGGGVALTAGATRCVPIPESGTLTSVRLQTCNGYDVSNACSSAGSATVDIRTATNVNYASTGPSAATTIKSTGALLQITSAYAVDGNITNWTTAGFGGTTACAVLTAPTAITVDVIIVVN